MLKVTRVNNQRLDLELSGKLDSELMQTALDELINKACNIENGVMLYDIIDFHLPSLGAMGVELSRIPSMFRLMNQFSKVAVLADASWLKKVSEVEGFFYPGLEIKAFDRAQKTEALLWLDD